MDKEQFYKKFINMVPMRYHEADIIHNKSKEMLNNKDGQFSAMRKYDGEWCRAIIMEDGVLLQSRSISKKTGTYGDKTALIPHITEDLKECFPAGTVLLGELAFDDFESTSREVGSILRCLPPKAIDRQKNKKLHYFIFDILAYNYEDRTDLPFIERITHTDSCLFEEFKVGTEYSFVEIYNNNFQESYADFLGFAEWVWEHGGEGIIIVRNDMPYQPGKRTAWASLKVKKKLGVLIAKIIGFIEPNKLYEGKELDNWKYFVDQNNNPADLTKMIDYGSLTPVTKPYYYGWKNGVIVEYQGRTIKVTSGLTDEFREWFASSEADYLLHEQQLYVKITGMELTEDSIRHPVFLDIDKSKIK